MTGTIFTDRTNGRVHSLYDQYKLLPAVPAPLSDLIVVPEITVVVKKYYCTYLRFLLPGQKDVTVQES